MNLLLLTIKTPMTKSNSKASDIWASFFKRKELFIKVVKEVIAGI